MASFETPSRALHIQSKRLFTSRAFDEYVESLQEEMSPRSDQNAFAQTGSGRCFDRFSVEPGDPRQEVVCQYGRRYSNLNQEHTLTRFIKATAPPQTPRHDG